MERLVRHVSTVSYMVCDESLVILAMDTGYVVAFDAHLGELKYEVMDCNRSQWDMATQVDIGPSKAVAVSGKHGLPSPTYEPFLLQAVDWSPSLTKMTAESSIVGTVMTAMRGDGTCLGSRC